MALRNLPYYWGYCVRYITLNDDTAAIYEPGSVITWMEFSSTKKGSEAASSFSNRNCKFIIWSIKGRHIARFSNYGEVEDEVLFTPFTRLLVIKREHSDGQYVIHLREVELGLTTKGLPLLWVDDNILGKEFEMKAMMEEAMVKAGREIKYILKPSTHLALALLESWFGLQVRKNSHFRVISDMGRPREPEGTHAGAILAREIWGLKLSVPIMIFTSNASAGLSKVGEKAPNMTARVLTSPEKGKPKANEVLITHSHKAAFAFCSFEGAADKPRFKLNDRVECRDDGNKWWAGKVVSVEPLLVQPDGDAWTKGFTWDEVRPPKPAAAAADLPARVASLRAEATQLVRMFKETGDDTLKAQAAAKLRESKLLQAQIDQQGAGAS